MDQPNESKETFPAPGPIERCDACGAADAIGYGRACTACIVRHEGAQAPMLYKLLESSRAAAWRKVDELQAHCTMLEDKRRMWQHRCAVYEQAFSALVLKGAEALFTLADNSEAARTLYNDGLDRVQRIVHRADALEADAWTRCAACARDFVRAAKEHLASRPDTIDDAEFISRWRETFTTALAGK